MSVRGDDLASVGAPPVARTLSAGPRRHPGHERLTVRKPALAWARRAPSGARWACSRVLRVSGSWSFALSPGEAPVPTSLGTFAGPLGAVPLWGQAAASTPRPGSSPFDARIWMPECRVRRLYKICKVPSVSSTTKLYSHRPSVMTGGSTWIFLWSFMADPPAFWLLRSGSYSHPDTSKKRATADAKEYLVQLRECINL